MIKQHKVFALIPTRSRSKRINNKNIRLLKLIKFNY